ncbi:MULTISPECIES: hypothetical protein [Bacteria]|jgi:hypothetical protein|uniref:Uncharacterized protein n=8 Tax=root TaxID=1 RepID=A0A8S5UHR7_9CAUD|nr:MULTISPECIES: hypothetical protein [Enterococcus]ELG7156249.1 hypothetical protein [Staphylococcus aureus]DAF94041.1 MAG TPA: hypothetical protein [Myoviridae sp. ctu2j3]HDH7443158.1 hypothetical protein [Escherichia coli]ELL1201126.1 hypothetical protein [Staphylococcus aureus]MDN3040602.1 hypothetical protein [Enterococcus faecium]
MHVENFSINQQAHDTIRARNQQLLSMYSAWYTTMVERGVTQLSSKLGADATAYSIAPGHEWVAYDTKDVSITLWVDHPSTSFMAKIEQRIDYDGYKGSSTMKMKSENLDELLQMLQKYAAGEE